MQNRNSDDLTNQITDSQIKTLRSEAERHGDLRQAMICVLALGGTEALDGAEPGTEADMLLSEGRTREWARVTCARVIADAQGQS